MACGGAENIDESVHEDDYDSDDMSFDQQVPDTFQNFQLSSGFVLTTKVIKEEKEGNSSLTPASTSVDFNFLKRPSKISLINGFGDNSQGFQFVTGRLRRNNLPFLNRRTLFLPARIRTPANRIFQIKQEEKMDIARREAVHERQVHAIMEMAQNWEEIINLDDNASKPITIRSIRPIPLSPVASLKKPKKDSQDHLNV